MKRRFFRRGSIQDVQDEVRASVFIKLRDELGALRDSRLVVRAHTGGIRISFLLPKSGRGKLFPPCDKDAGKKLYEGKLMLIVATYAKRTNVAIERFSVVTDAKGEGGHDCQLEEGIVFANAFKHPMFHPTSILGKMKKTASGRATLSRVARIEEQLSKQIRRPAKKSVETFYGPLLHNRPNVVSTGFR